MCTIVLLYTVMHRKHFFVKIVKEVYQISSLHNYLPDNEAISYCRIPYSLLCSLLNECKYFHALLLLLDHRHSVASRKFIQNKFTFSLYSTILCMLCKHLINYSTLSLECKKLKPSSLQGNLLYFFFYWLIWHGQIDGCVLLLIYIYKAPKYSPTFNLQQ
jgi:hypothetical protein